jgi:hypothetical protein
MYRNFDLESEIKLVGYQWKCDSPEYVVCLIHGIGEHAGRYDRTGEAFNEAGIDMVGMDLRGHGHSPGTRGHTSPRADVLADIDRLMEYIQNEYPELPVFIYGHSMGGNIALDYRKRGRYRSAPAGYIISSPWILLQRKIPKPLYLFALGMSKVKPDFRMRAKIKPEQLGNPEIILKQDNFHLVHDSITVKTALEGLEIAKLLMNDRLETLAIKKLLNEDAYKVAISSTKSMTGHLLGAAGAIEAIACLMAITESIIPPTINYMTPDEECDLDYVPNKPRNEEVRYALSNSLGFGGHNATILLKKYE